MAVTYEGSGVRPIGTMTCDRACGATFHDGKAETEGPLIHMRAYEAGWEFERPNAYQQRDVCPDCQTNRENTVEETEALDSESDEAMPCGEGMCRCYCTSRQHACGCDCPRDEDGQLIED